ncbi:hypothetical protein [Serratia sp. JSRIV006]|uniref:hypothetical protein n=1 Tax=Serratia sp. JSRIV006 TaxID=2831896 RepID=UPI001CBD59F8|nr:hypothetical protein [Serratia sp. JSRIV006]UAN65756.1 hypothetical protein KGP16_26860 [Serratia sp. JSRIV006]
MTDVNVGGTGLELYPDEYKDLLKKVLACINNNDGSFDIDSLSLELKFIDREYLSALVGKLKFHQLIMKDEREKMCLSDKGREAFPLDHW